MDKRIQALHEIALECGSGYMETEQAVYYSARNAQIALEEGDWYLSGEYDLRTFLRFYNEEADARTRALLFEAAIPCSHCISDKCTTLLMAEKRTIELGDQRKKLCAPFRHWLRIRVTAEDTDACRAIFRMMLKDTPAHLHRSAPVQVSYHVEADRPFYLLALLTRHTPIGPTDEDFIRQTLASGRLPTATHYHSAIEHFQDGAHYDFLFGARLAEKPDPVPEGMVLRRVREGDWAEYPYLGDLPALWRHFTGSFYDLERKGFDRARPAMEVYDADGRLLSVRVPVDADEPRDAGRVVTLQWMPNYQLAGYMSFAECDHPEFVDRGFSEVERIKQRFPDWWMLVRASIHQWYGKPLRGIDGVPVDDFTPIPDDVERHEIQGGLWRLSKSLHFNGGIEDWPFDVKLEARMPINDCQHPRAFNQYIYKSRGGYTEIGVPMRPAGVWHYDEMELTPFDIWARLEDPLHGDVVSDADFEALFNHPANPNPGTRVIAYRVALPNGIMLFSDPLRKGFCAGETRPEGFLRYPVGGGRYVRVTEDARSCGTGWELECICDLEERCGRRPDLSRWCHVIETGHGERFELYIPIY